MKIGTTSYEPCVRFGWKKGLALIKESGFDCVDFSLEKEIVDEIGGEFRSWATEMRAYLDDIGLECHQAHAPCNTVLYGDKFDESHPGFMDVVNSMETASILGA